MSLLRSARRPARLVARTGVVVSATMLVLSMWAALSQSADSAGAATSAGAAELITPSNGTPSGGGALLTTGGSSTLFTVRLPAVANCTGDSANGNYRVQSYMVPSTVDPGGLTFDSSGPKPNGTGADFRQPLYTKVGGSGYTDAQTADAVTQPGPGQIINIPTFSLDVYSSTELLPGAYNVGIACTKGPASTTQVDKFWNLQMTVVTDPTDSPTKIKWTVLASQATTTSSSSSSTTTSTTVGSTTTTTAGGSATTTTSGSAADTTTTTSFAVVAMGSDVTPQAQVETEDSSPLPRTGGSLQGPLVWAGLLVVSGRIAILLSKSVEVR